MEFLKDTVFLGNNLLNYAIVLVVFIAAVIIIKILKRIFENRLEKKIEAVNETEKRKYQFLLTSYRKILIPLLYLGAIYLAISILSFGKTIDKIFNIVYIVVVSLFAIRLAITAINFFILRYIEKKRSEEEQKRIKPLISFLNLFIWLIGLLFLFDNLGFEISTIVAGLGISGIAVALAAQAMLGDLFSYFVIYFDKPFEIGDFIIFDNKLGSIESIGVKSTKIRSLSGEQMVVSNSNLTNKLLHNYKRMHERRIVFSIGVTYQTPPEAVEEIPTIIREIIEGISGTRFDRSHFKTYGDYSLIFETVYYVLSPDYNVYMDKQQEINFNIYRSLNERGIEFAYPTQTVFVERPEGT